MHIEDRLSELAINLESQVRIREDKINRLEKRLESTEAQIRKLFALSDAFNRPKHLHEQLEEIEDRQTNSKSIKLLGFLREVNVLCPSCTRSLPYYFADGKRSISLTDDGNIREIYYTFNCRECAKDIVIKF